MVYDNLRYECLGHISVDSPHFEFDVSVFPLFARFCVCTISVVMGIPSI